MPTDYGYTHTRADWVKVTEPVKGPAPFPWDTADRIAIHYTAALNLIDGDPGENWAGIPAYLRAIHHDYLTSPERGYSIGYGIAVDQRGETWQLRGVTWRNAANLNWNHRTLAILCLVDAADELRPPAVEAVRSIVAWFRRESPFAAGVKIVGHRDIGATACPGNGIYTQISHGVLEPLPDPPPPPDDEEEDDMALEKIVKPSGVWAQPWWPWLACFTSGAVRPAVSGESATAVIVIDEGQYRRLCAAANIQLTTEKP